MDLIILLLVFSIITGYVFQIKKINEYKTQIAQVTSQIKDTKEEISKLEKSSKNNDLESMARNQLGMIKQNEIIYLDSDERDN